MAIISTLTLLSVFISLLTVYLVHWYIQFRRSVDQFDGPPVSSLLYGNLDLLLLPGTMSKHVYLKSKDLVSKATDSQITLSQKCSEFYEYFESWFEKYRNSGVIRIWIGPLYAIYVLTKADYLKELLSSYTNVNKGFEYSFLAPWLGDGLLISEASTWHGRRKLLSTAFHVKILHDFLPIFNRHTGTILSTIEKKFTEKEANQVELENIMPLFEDLTLDVVKETSFGLNPHEKANQNAKYREALKGAFFGASIRIAHPHHWLETFYAWTERGRKFFSRVAYLNDYAESVISRRKRLLLAEPAEEEEANNEDEGNADSGIDESAKSTEPSLKGRIIVDILLKKALELPQMITRRAIKNEVNTFILGGHDTTAMALTFTTFMVGHHPAVEAKIYTELEGIFGPSTMDRPITADDLRQMRYLEMAIKESLRLWPSIQVIGRKLSEPLPLPNGKSIPAGASVYIPIIFLHRDPAYFPEPESYQPERFAPENKAAHQYAFLPFSAGPRNCIGQRYAMLELKFVLSSIFRKYRVCSVTDPGTVTKGISPTLKPMKPIDVKFERRAQVIVN